MIAESTAKRRKLTAEQVAGSQVRYSEVESAVAGSTGAALRERSVGCCTVTPADDPARYKSCHCCSILVHTDHSRVTQQLKASRVNIGRMALLKADSPLKDNRKKCKCACS